MSNIQNEFDQLFGTSSSTGEIGGLTTIRISENARQNIGGRQINVTGMSQIRSDGKTIRKNRRVLDTIRVNEAEFTMQRGDNAGFHPSHQTTPEQKTAFLTLWKSLLKEDAEIGVPFDLVKSQDM
jgi:hypothetical protein